MSAVQSVPLYHEQVRKTDYLVFTKVLDFDSAQI